ncbi:MAG: S-layer homology domain-containing protein, partial [Acidaminobacteraceae bacterium]
MRKTFSKILALTLLITSMSSASFSAEDLLVRVPEIVPAEVEAGTDINSYPKGIELLKNSYYNDISKNAYEEDITKMSAISVINKMGSSDYNPEQELTGYKALEVLVNLMGNSAAVQTRALASAFGMDASGVERAFNQEYEAEALALGIITNAELSNYNNQVNRETFALWVSRAAGVPPETTNLNNVYSYKDFGSIPTTSRAIVEAMVKNNIMPVGNDGNFRPKDNLTKGQAANVLNNASEFMKDGLNIVTNYGVIAKLKKDSNKTGSTTISTNDILVKNVDGTTSTLKTSYNSTTRQKLDFVVYKNGIITDSSALKVGDQIEYITKDGELRYVSIKESENFASQISDTIKNQENIKTYFGTIGSISNEQKWDKNQYIDRDRYRIKNFDGQTLDLLIETNKETGVKNDATVVKNGILGGSSLLKTGDNVEYLLKDNKLIYMSVKEIKNTVIPSTVRYVYKDPVSGDVTLTIFDYNNQILEYPVSPNVLVLINENYGEVTDLQYAQDVTVTVTNGKVTKVISESFIENPGYIPKFGKVRFGLVNYVYPDSINMELANGEIVHFKVESGIPIIKSGEIVSFRALKQGDKVKVYFDNISSVSASAIEVEAAERLIKQIYKGNITD